MSNTNELSSTLIDAALAASQRGDSARALALLDQASQIHPSSGIPHFLMAAEFASLGQVEQAELSFSNAVLLEPGMAIARYQLGLLQYSSGRPAAALVTWQPLLDQGEASPFPHWARGFGALAQDQFEVARKHFETGVQLNKVNPPMSSDILKILAEIDAVQRRNLGAHSQPSPSAIMDEADASSHFLVSNYERQGTVH